MSSTYPVRRGAAVLFPVLAAISLGSSVLADDGALGAAATAQGIAYGLSLAPVPLDLKGLDRALVARGSYIVNAQINCNGCHSTREYAPGGDPFEGEPARIDKAHYLAGGQEFGPGVVSTNLTPDARGLPEGHTYKQFLGLMRTGRDPDDGHILQVMPWPVYRNMTDHDLRAIYEYLRAVPSRGRHEGATATR
jgi:hypothetical protein